MAIFHICGINCSFLCCGFFVQLYRVSCCSPTHPSCSKLA
ncbi:hypothetical protein OESDEN_14350 [Oesophagostomum dentatum]|uniref:Uncharacterized protein n=1 Tax=Oesophagostomum dentatum TaxID=61180 RepID=A0A0B1SQV8_OESDE|nr:hypothetical protein OESDEN_14350 [Oesophagostomum dentatum]